MKKVITLIVIALPFMIYTQNDTILKPSVELRKKWGDFGADERIKYRLIDYSKTPVYKKITKKGELLPEYQYLDSIDIYEIVYESDGLMVTGFMVRPRQQGNFPCIIYNRGGNRDYGQLLVGTAVVQMGNIASKGYVVIASNYRGNSGSEGMEEFGGSDVNDVLNLAEAVGQIESADTTRMGLLGISRGGMMTYQALRKSDRFKAAVIIGGMSDLLNMAEFHEGMEEEVFSELIPDYSLNRDSLLKERSANYWTDEIAPQTKILILHGEKDVHVSVEEVRELNDSLNTINHPHVYVEFEGANHGILQHNEEVSLLIATWFEDYLKNDLPFKRGESKKEE